MQTETLGKRRAAGPSGPRLGVRTIIEMAKDESGATIIDYAFLIGLVAMAALEAFYQTGAAVKNLFDAIATAYVQALAPAP